MRRVLPCVVAIVFLVACRRTESGKAEVAKRSKAPVSLGNLESESAVFPLVKGDAYLVAEHESGPVLYYLRGGEATRVLGIAEKTFNFAVHPLADGTAYLTALDEDSLRLKVYRLADGQAAALSEVTKVGVGNPSGEPLPEGFLWALLQREINTVRTLKEEARDAETEAGPAEEEEPL